MTPDNPAKCECDRKFMRRLAHPDRYNVDYFCWNCGWENGTAEGRAALYFSFPATDEQEARAKTVLPEPDREGVRATRLRDGSVLFRD